MDTCVNWLKRVNPSTFYSEKEKVWCNPANVRAWAKEAINPSPRKRLYSLYRAFGDDIDADLARAAPFFLATGASELSPPLRATRIYDLKIIWRFLLRNYAYCDALAVGRVLRGLHEPWPWRAWRFKDLFLPRLFIGVLAGFILLSAGSLTVEILLAAAKANLVWFWGILAGCAVIVLGLAIAEVQRRVGRRPWTTIAGRALLISALGAVYGTAGGLVTGYGGWALGFRPMPSHVVLCSAVAVLLGFTLQLFWQEKSIGDPL